MKNFAYIHVERLRDMGRGKKATRQYKPRSYTRYWGVQGCWEHDMRLIETANADPERFALNSIVCEETDWEPAPLTSATIRRTECNRADFVSKKAEDFIAKHHTGDRLRDNSVRVCMLLSAVSPQWLRDMSTPEWNEYLTASKEGLPTVLRPLNEEKVRRWKQATRRFYRKKFGDRILCFMFHDDELNPHCTVYMVPLVEKQVAKRGRKCKDPDKKGKEFRTVRTLCAKELFTPDPKIWERGKDGKRGKWIILGQGTCSIMQDEYAEFLQAEGLDVRRGNRRTRNQPALKHETNRERYQRTLAATEAIKSLPDSELRPFLEAKAGDMADADRLRIERDHHQIIAADNQERATKLEKQTAELERKISDSQRELPVADVIAKLTGLDPIEPDDGPMPPGPGSPPKKKRTDIQLEFMLQNGMRLGVNNQNGFENLTPDVPFVGKYAKRLKGKGALDAVMFLTGWEFKEASEWLADTYSPEDAARVIAKRYEASLAQNPDDDERIRRKSHAETIARELETPDESQWESVKNTLLKTYKFREAVIDHPHEMNWLDANRHGHIVFQKGRWDEEGDVIPTGKIIVDLQNPTAILKETGDNGLYLDIDGTANKVVICASPMDALAIRSTPEHYSSTVVVIGKNPSEKTIAALKRIKKHRGVKLLAENLTGAGKRLASWMREHFPEIETLPLPKGFQNWLDYHRRPRLKSDPADLRVVEFPHKEIDGPGEIAME